MNKQHIVTVTGPSLTGKTTLESLLKMEGFSPVVSTTTRAMRSGEEDGIHYHFIEKKESDKRLDRGEFVEFVKVDSNFYGVGKLDVQKALLENGKAIIVCEPHGAKQVFEHAKKEGIPITRVYLNNSSQVLFERFLERFKSDTKATVERYASRLSNMVDFERDAWTKPAMDGTDQYEMVFNSFGPENQLEVIEKIKNAVEANVKKKLKC